MNKPIQENSVSQEMSPSDIGRNVFDDKELEEKEFLAEFGGDESIEAKGSGRKRRYITCFDCNRTEGHFLATGQRWFFSFLLGLTFGGVLLVGPYKCQCCGANRLMISDMLNPRYWLREIAHRKISRLRK